jgi:hypothetical protein
MATHTLATSGNLTAVTYSQAPTVLLPADLATIAQLILNDPGPLDGTTSTYETSMMVGAHSIVPGAFNYMGILTIPGRGFLRLVPGDIVAVDSTANVGWPIVISANAKTNGPWTFT